MSLHSQIASVGDNKAWDTKERPIDQVSPSLRLALPLLLFLLHHIALVTYLQSSDPSNQRRVPDSWEESWAATAVAGVSPCIFCLSVCIDVRRQSGRIRDRRH